MLKVVAPADKSTLSFDESVTSRLGVTGRDGFIVAKALAYAITAIEQLPSRWQERSDCNDMRAILNAWFGQSVRNWVIHNARDHLHQQSVVDPDVS